MMNLRQPGLHRGVLRVALLNREINNVLADPAAKQKIEDLGAIVRTVTPDEFARFVAGETTKYQHLVKQIGIKPE